MIEQHILQKLSYGSLKALLIHGKLSFDENYQVIKEASVRPYAEKKLFKLLKKHED